MLRTHPSSCFHCLQRQRLREMRQQRKAEARAVAAVVDADALAEQEAKALELQVGGMMLQRAQHSPAVVPQHELLLALLQCRQHSTVFVWTVVVARLKAQSLCWPSQQSLCGAKPLILNHAVDSNGWLLYSGALSSCSLQTCPDNHCTLCLWAAWLRLSLQTLPEHGHIGTDRPY